MYFRGRKSVSKVSTFREETNFKKKLSSSDRDRS